MKRCLVLLALFASACGSPPATNEQASLAVPPTAQAQGSTPAAARGGSAAPSAQAASQQKPAQQALVIPKGARYTIFCESFTGDDHVQRAVELKNILMAHAKAKGWYVIHQNDQSTVYHGYYSDFDVANARDAATKREAERAQNDKKTVESLPNPLNPSQKLFPRALFVTLDSPDPDAPTEWNLVNTGGAYTVEIAAYSGFERKQAAIESVREARKMGVPAYFHHGPSYSLVCIGSWPASAVVEQSTEQVNSIAQGSDVFVDVQGGEIPPQIREQLRRQGRNVQVVVPKVKILDKTLLDTLNAYPEHAVDGYTQMETVIDPATNKKVERPKHSMLVRIPAADGSSQTFAADDPNQPPAAEPAAPRGNNLGARLRGLNP